MSIATLISDTVNLWRQRPAPVAAPVDHFPDVADAPPDTRRLIRDRRYCHVLANHNDMQFDDASLQFAWKALEHEMALVPGGEVTLVSNAAIATHRGFELATDLEDLVTVESLYIDRHCVTNRDFARFVEAGGYGDPQFWPEQVLPNLLQFTDSTGQPGPKFWSDGKPPEDKLDHPVVGLCWYEANAYAAWVGKRLPSTEEWQRAGTWPKGNGGNGSEIRFTWGNAFDPSKANIWASGHGDTMPVCELSAGSTPNGVRQLIGNVWEWVDAQFLPVAEEGVSVILEEAMGEIRGAAFDTYFHSQATCQFRTGQPLLARTANVGFRCCISAANVPTPPESDPDYAATDETN